MSVSRRSFLRLAGGLGLVGATAGLHLVDLGPRPQTGNLLRSGRPLPAAFAVPLPVPAVARPVGTGGGVDRYEVTQREADVEVLPGTTTRVWGYDGTFPGPTIRGRSGRPVEVRFRNELAVPTAVHLHGGHTPADSDGYPLDLVLPAGTRAGHDGGAGGGHAGHAGAGDHGGDVVVGHRDHRYPLGQRAATLWYHDHAMDVTGPHVYRGLAGFFLVADDEDDALGLPGDDRELPLMIADRAFDGDGAFLYPALSPDGHPPGVEERYMAGVLGDVVLVNGAPWPAHEVSGTTYRLRLLNASNARRYELALEPEGGAAPLAFTQVGTDGGLLDAPRRRSTVTLAPGERVDAVVDFGAVPTGTRVVLANRLGRGSTARVMRFDVVRDGPDDAAVPDRLGTVARLPAGEAVATRTFAFQLRRAPGVDAPEGDDTGLGPHRWTVSGHPYEPGRDLATPRLGDVEVWRFLTDLHHPVHVHLDQFQVLARNGRDPGPGDHGWKDTVDLLPGETCEVAVRFTDHAGRYVLHCHNLEHEDMAMMADFSVS
jgi:spore coat protein A, manganese oxidase